MKKRARYLKSIPVIAVQLDLDTQGLRYRKWGSLQRAKRGDWLVKNGKDTYTIDRQSFARTYRRKPARPGEYLKITPVWAEIAKTAGSIKTKEGRSHYKRGDYLVFNEASGADGYCISAAKFKAMYKRAR